MGTKFRTMLAPIGLSTGDGRRFAAGGITLAEVPFPFEWVRSREGGHNGAVGVGVVQEARVGTVKEAVANGWISEAAAKGMDNALEAVWATGQMFDDVDREEMPRLAEDVAEAIMLMSQGTLGPSVDLDSFEGVPVMEGTDDPVTWEDIEDYYEEHGEEPKIELLVTEGRVRAATLVSIPAFAETSRPLELITEEALAADSEGEGGGSGGNVAGGDDGDGSGGNVAALIASVATAVRPLAADFDPPAFDRPTPITFDWDRGLVFGHIATWKTCHVGYADVCVTAPKDSTGDYAWFNRYPVETEDGGTVWAGRITVGGRHAALDLGASAAMTQYDAKNVAAHVRAYEDQHGIAVVGVIELAADAPERAVLDRRKVSGDWRETPGGLSLVEVLALSPGPRQHAEPGFPVPGTFSSHGRQTALTAALGPDALDMELTRIDRRVRGELAGLDVDALAAALEQRQIEREARTSAAAELAALIKIDADKERMALAAALGEEG